MGGAGCEGFSPARDEWCKPSFPPRLQNVRACNPPTHLCSSVRPMLFSSTPICSSSVKISRSRWFRSCRGRRAVSGGSMAAAHERRPQGCDDGGERPTQAGACDRTACTSGKAIAVPHPSTRGKCRDGIAPHLHVVRLCALLIVAPQRVLADARLVLPHARCRAVGACGRGVVVRCAVRCEVEQGRPTRAQALSKAWAAVTIMSGQSNQCSNQCATAGSCVGLSPHLRPGAAPCGSCWWAPACCSPPHLPWLWTQVLVLLRGVGPTHTHQGWVDAPKDGAPVLREGAPQCIMPCVLVCRRRVTSLHCASHTLSLVPPCTPCPSH